MLTLHMVTLDLLFIRIQGTTTCVRLAPPFTFQGISGQYVARAPSCFSGHVLGRETASIIQRKGAATQKAPGQVLSSLEGGGICDGEEAVTKQSQNWNWGIIS